MDYDIYVDTALSMDGVFPPPDPEEDYEVEIGTMNEDTVLVLVSSRYVGATDEADAARIALGAVCERYGYEMDDEGEVVDVEHEGETVKPVWLVEVRRPAPEEDAEPSDEWRDGWDDSPEFDGEGRL